MAAPKNEYPRDNVLQFALSKRSTGPGELRFMLLWPACLSPQHVVTPMKPLQRHFGLAFPTFSNDYTAVRTFTDWEKRRPRYTRHEQFWIAAQSTGSIFGIENSNRRRGDRSSRQNIKGKRKVNVNFSSVLFLRCWAETRRVTYLDNSLIRT
jgi:hypothetical protein